MASLRRDSFVARKAIANKAENLSRSARSDSLRAQGAPSPIPACWAALRGKAGKQLKQNRSLRFLAARRSAKPSPRKHPRRSGWLHSPAEKLRIPLDRWLPPLPKGFRSWELFRLHPLRLPATSARRQLPPAG